MAEWCTKQSFSPFAGVMKPKPLVSLNHFTVPVVRIAELLDVFVAETMGVFAHLFRVNGALTRGLPYANGTVPRAQRRGAKTKKGPRNAGPYPSELTPSRSTGCVAETNSNTSVPSAIAPVLRRLRRPPQPRPSAPPPP